MSPLAVAVLTTCSPIVAIANDIWPASPLGLKWSAAHSLRLCPGVANHARELATAGIDKPVGDLVYRSQAVSRRIGDLT